MSPTEAFWTLRILPRIGSSAWKSEDRASLAVPSALVAFDDEQFGASDVVGATVGELGGHGGGFQRVLAARDFLLLARRDAGPHLADDLFLQQRGLGLVVAVWGIQHRGNFLFHDLGDDGAHGEVPRISLVWPSNCGSASRTVTTAVSPARCRPSRSFVAVLELAGVGLHGLAQHLEQSLLKAGLVGAALGRRDDVDEAADRVRSRSPSAARRRPRSRATSAS